MLFRCGCPDASAGVVAQTNGGHRAERREPVRAVLGSSADATFPRNLPRSNTPPRDAAPALSRFLPSCRTPERRPREEKR